MVEGYWDVEHCRWVKPVGGGMSHRIGAVTTATGGTDLDGPAAVPEPRVPAEPVPAHIGVDVPADMPTVESR